MASEVAGFILFKLLLPLCLLVACLFRYNGISLIYLLCLLIIPFLTRPTSASQKGHTGRFQVALLIISVLACFSQLVFQVTLLAMPPYANMLTNCSSLESTLRQVGWARLDIEVGNAIRLVAPDAGIFLVALVTHLVCRRMAPPVLTPDLQEVLVRREVKSGRAAATWMVLDTLLVMTAVVLTAVAGVMLPSLLSAVYFLSFLVVATVWACYHQLNRRLLSVWSLLAAYSALHLVLLYLYQMQFFQQAVPPDSLAPRLLGLTAIILTDCSDPYHLHLNRGLDWPYYANPPAIFVFYFFIAIHLKTWYNKATAAVKEEPHRPGETRPESGGGGRRKKRRRNRSGESTLLVDSSAEEVANYSSIGASPGAATAQGGGGLEEEEELDTVPPDSPSATPPPAKPPTRRPVVTILVFIMKQSYIAALIAMMAWSIVYHSWLTFVLLLWACVMWIIPDSRRACYVSSPLLVIFAEALLLQTYVCGLDLTQDELPIGSTEFLREFGLIKYRYPCLVLAIQLIFIFFFWLTLRQYLRKRMLEKLHISDDAIILRPFTPFVRSISTDDGVGRDGLDGEDSESMKRLGQFLNGLLAKYWIVLCGAMFLIVSLNFNVVMYRIIYMALFLINMLVFVIHFGFWRLLLSLYWWVVVIYSMIVLGIVYTFQFEYFPDYWKNLTHLNDQELADLGLVPYDTGGLVKGLLTPTIFVIVVVIQLQYYHKPFMKMCVVPNSTAYRVTSTKDEEEGPVDNTERLGAGRPGDGVDEVDISRSQSHSSVKMKHWLRRTCEGVVQWYQAATVLAWRLLEIHINKLVYFTVVMVALEEVSATNMVFVAFLFWTIPFTSFQGIFCFCSILLGSAGILGKMVYQLNSFPSLNFVCNESDSTYDFPVTNQTFSEYEWFGLVKSSDIGAYTTGYVFIVLMVVLRQVVRVHQSQYRKENGIAPPPVGILFLDTSRKNADISLISMAKFLTNFFFYKFGLEMCFIMTAITVCVRLDIYAVVYGTWLVVLLFLNRRVLFFIWPFYLIFLALLFPLLYFSCLGYPTFLCAGYSFTEVLHPNLIQWLYLPSYTSPPNPNKLIADFFQLLLVCCQWQVFRSESHHDGGSNEPITADVVTHPKVIKSNPLQDFTDSKTLLDSLKVGVFDYMLWVTMIFVFLAGTTRVNIFCLGYLVYVFYLLWHGQNYLIRPLHSLLKLWNGLVGYTLAVLYIKACLQIVSCVYLNDWLTDDQGQVKDNLCWITSLFNLICLQEGYTDQDAYENACNLTKDQAGLAWDGFCFAVLLVQKRVFTTHYFQYVVMAVQDQKDLASKGAELITKFLEESVRKREEEERKIVEGLRKKVERVRSKQEKVKDKIHLETDDHYKAVRSGNADMFEDSDAEQESGIESDDESDMVDNLEVTDAPPKPPPPPSSIAFAKVAKLMHLGITKGTHETLKQDRAMKALEKEEHQKSKEQSAPLMRFRAAAFRASIRAKALPPGAPGAQAQAQAQAGKEEGDALGELPEGAVVAGMAGAGEVEDMTVVDSKGDKKVEEVEAAAAAAKEPVTGEEGKKEGGEAEEEEKEEEEEEEDKETVGDKVLNGLRLAWIFLLRLTDLLIEWLFALSADFRTTAKFLTELRKRKKCKRTRKCKNGNGSRRQSGGKALDVGVGGGDEEGGGAEHAKRLAQKGGEQGQEPQPPSPHHTAGGEDSVDEDEEEEDSSFELVEEDGAGPRAGPDLVPVDSTWGRPRLVRLLYALWYAFQAHSDLLCYFLMILNVLVSGSVLSIPYALSIFLWALLSKPRPSKLYWIVAISYTMVVVLVKYLFQFSFFPWNTEDVDNANADNPLWAPRIIGVEKQDNYAVYDLLILFSLFFHRSILMVHGLWSESHQRTGGDDKKRPDEGATPAPDVVDSQEINLLGAAPSTAEASSDTGDEEVLDDDVEGEEKDMTWDELVKPFREFYHSIINPKLSAVTDVYTFLFMLDFICFLITVFGYSSFGESLNSGAVTDFFVNNTLPLPTVLMWIAQFLMMLVDRGIYLRKNQTGKLIFQVLLVIVINVWLLFILPYLTARSFNENVAAQLYYFTKSVYLGLSAYQIRCGYPASILGNFLTKSYNIVSLFLFKGFRLIPFLLEMRVIMDWMYTETTLSLSHWMFVEDVYYNAYEEKCWRKRENDVHMLRGTKQSRLLKYFMGGLALLGLVVTIWFPLLFFSLVTTTSDSNPPTSCTVQIQLGGYEPIYKVTIQSNLQPLTPEQRDGLSDLFSDSLDATTFIKQYQAEDIYWAALGSDSMTSWVITPPGRDELQQLLNSTQKINIYFYYSFDRDPSSSLVSDIVYGEVSKELVVGSKERTKLANILQDPITGQSVLINYLYPQYVQVPATGKVEPASFLLPEGEQSYSNLSLSLEKGAIADLEGEQEWWSTNTSTAQFTLVSFNDRVVPPSLSFIASFGIIGLYISLVLVIGRFVRMFFSGVSYTAMFEELPNLDRILRLCRSVYIVRESAEFLLEEELFAKLLYLYRSPEMLYKWTKLKQA